MKYKVCLLSLLIAISGVTFAKDKFAQPAQSVCERAEFIQNGTTLQTARLTLRPLSIDDAVDVFEYAQKEEVSKFKMWSPHKTIEDTIKQISFLLAKQKEGFFLPFAVWHKEDKKVIGMVGLTSTLVGFMFDRAELDFSFSPLYWGKGYATEMCKALLKFGFERIGLNRIEGKVRPENAAAVRVLQKSAMSYEGRLREYFHDFKQNHDGYYDVEVYSVLRSEFNNNEKTKSV